MGVVVSYKYEANPCLSSLLCNQVVTGLVNCPMAPALISRVGSSSRQAAKSAKSNDEVRKVC